MNVSLDIYPLDLRLDKFSQKNNIINITLFFKIKFFYIFNIILSKKRRIERLKIIRAINNRKIIYTFKILNNQ